MAVPYMANTLKGWTTKRTIQKMQQTVVNHKPTVSIVATYSVDINIQPVPQYKVDRKPDVQRTWKWWSIIIKNPPSSNGEPLFKTNDIIVVNNIKYKIQSGSDWSESGFEKYECIEDYQ